MNIKLFFIAFVLFLLFCHTLDSFKKDNCDSSIGERCRMKVHVDALTGCQYLSTMFSRPVPRMTAQGKQLCATKIEGVE